MKTIYKNYEIKQFSTFSETVKLLNSNYTPKNITGWEIYSKLQKFYESGEYVYLGCTIINPLLGEFSFELEHINTTQLSTGNYIYDIAAKLPDNTVHRIQSGAITVTAGLTNFVSEDLPPLPSGSGVNNWLDGGTV